MKKKFLSLLLAIFMVVPCVFALTACGEKDNSLDYLAFTLLEDGTYSVALKDNFRRNKDNMMGADYEQLNNKKIKIPSKYEGVAVTQIGDYGFWDGHMSKVEIPSTVTYIGRDAFSGCYWIESIDIPDNVKVISEYAFGHCENLQSVVVPDSVEYIGIISPFDEKVDIFYEGTAEQFNQIKTVSHHFDFSGNPVVEYYDEPFNTEGRKWFVYEEDTSDITDYISEDKKIRGIWKYGKKNAIESVAIEYSDTVNGNTYEYTNSVVTLTDEYWQMLLSAKEQGMLETVLSPEQVTMFNESANKEEFATKLSNLNATLLQDMTVVFADGKFTLWQKDAQYSQPLDYLEVNGAIYYGERSVYKKAYVIENGKLVEDNSTEYGGAKHYYELKA